jgi:hypothetical protein
MNNTLIDFVEDGIINTEFESQGIAYHGLKPNRSYVHLVRQKFCGLHFLSIEENTVAYIGKSCKFDPEYKIFVRPKAILLLDDETLCPNVECMKGGLVFIRNATLNKEK